MAEEYVLWFTCIIRMVATQDEINSEGKWASESRPFGNLGLEMLVVAGSKRPDVLLSWQAEFACPESGGIRLMPSMLEPEPVPRIFRLSSASPIFTKAFSPSLTLHIAWLVTQKKGRHQRRKLKTK